MLKFGFFVEVFVALNLTVIYSNVCYGQESAPRPSACWNVTASEQAVADKYFRPYGNWQRPRLNSSEVVDVNITFLLSSINDVLEKERMIKLTGHLSVRWMDEFRVWSDDYPYNCVDYVVLSADEVWLPDIAQINAEEMYRLMSMPGEKVRIYNDGYTKYSPGGTFMAYCDFDLTYFPFDTQICSIQLESWRYTVNYMKFHFLGNLTIFGWSENEQWTLIGTDQSQLNLQYLEPGNAFDHIEFHLILKRKVMYYMMNIIIPSCIISVAQLTTFSLPSDEVLKIHVSFTCLLAYSVFQLMIVGDMPRSSDHVPLLSIYIDLQMAYIALSMVIEGGVFLALKRADDSTSHHRPSSDIPPSIYKFICIVGYLLLAGDRPEKYNNPDESQESKITLLRPDTFTAEMEPMRGYLSMFEHVPIIITSKPFSADEPKFRNGDEIAATQQRRKLANARQLRWQYTADVIDRLAFFVYFGCLVLTPIVMFGICPALLKTERQ